SEAGAVLEPCAGSHHDVAVRLGLGSVRGIGSDLAEEVVAEREAGGPFLDAADLSRRTGLTRPQLEALATAGAFEAQNRREALWAAGAAAQSKPGRLPGIVTGTDAPTLPGMTEHEEALADLWATGMTAEGHPTRFVREVLDRLGVVTASGLAAHPTDAKVVVGGVVTHRQRPATAGGTIFINLEDETGLINVVCSKGCWARHRHVARTAPAMLVRGRLERAEGVTNVIAEKLELLPLGADRLRSRDFR
ncbi:MAG TPA: OB-fold nucleic acid binding domain-containing protein, partial [Acidimicrobiales bacterium]